MNKINQFRTFHNFTYESSSLKGIGEGKLIPYDDIYITHQGPTMLQTIESQGFYDHPEKREIKRRVEASKKTKSPMALFHCSVHGCI